MHRWGRLELAEQWGRVMEPLGLHDGRQHNWCISLGLELADSSITVKRPGCLSVNHAGSLSMLSSSQNFSRQWNFNFFIIISSYYIIGKSCWWCFPHLFLFSSPYFRITFDSCETCESDGYILKCNFPAAASKLTKRHGKMSLSVLIYHHLWTLFCSTERFLKII